MKALAGEVKSASQDTVDGLNMVSNGLHGFASGTLQGSFEGIQNMLTGLSKLNIGGKVGDAISQMSKPVKCRSHRADHIGHSLHTGFAERRYWPIISSLIDHFQCDNRNTRQYPQRRLFKQIGGSLVKGIGDC